MCLKNKLTSTERTDLKFDFMFFFGNAFERFPNFVTIGEKLWTDYINISRTFQGASTPERSAAL
jgi:hypothetical protein